MGTPLVVAEMSIPPGSRQRTDLRIARLSSGTWLSLPVEIVNGVNSGPRIWISAAVHGDEVNGVEITRRVMELLDPEQLSGTVIATPIVNVFGFIEQSRYLPDRRDLNRSFPGSSSGSMASRLAHLFMQEVVSLCSYGIDLHTGSNYRTNLPQIRANLQNEETRRCAEAFSPPVIMHSQTRDGSLRQAATQRGIHMLLYEAGEPLRFDEESIALGVEGILRVMATLEMRAHESSENSPNTIEIQKSSWVRARRSGIMRLHVKLGEEVRAKQTMGIIADAFGEGQKIVKAPFNGIIIGHTTNPIVNQGDGIIHVGRV